MSLLKSPNHLALGLAMVMGVGADLASAKDKNKDKVWTPPPTVAKGGKGIPWTILCWEVQGLHRLSFVEQVADALRNTDGIRAKEVFIVTGEDEFVRLYYGEYFRKMNTRTNRREVPKKLSEDLALIRSLGVNHEESFFRFARMVPKPLPDVGNPGWALTRAEGIYTLQVAVFEPTDDFWDYKNAAAEYCAYLRGKGYEAYYHHAPASSIVSVGAFGPEAVIEYEKGRFRYSNEVLSLQEDELLRYNLVNGAVVRVKNASATVAYAPLSDEQVSALGGARAPKKNFGAFAGPSFTFDLAPQGGKDGALVTSRLVFIPGREHVVER